MEIKLTEEQRAAIETEGKVIVSASAGSGKTFVMIERLVSLILSGKSVENILAVTFTNKAAAQMRDKLRGAVIKKIALERENENLRAHLKEQLASLPLADISTIHSFCAKLVRTYFFFAGVDPSFRIVSQDDAEGKALSARALDEVFERAYEEGGEAFKELLAVYFRKKKDKFLRSLVLFAAGKVGDLADGREALALACTADKFDEAKEYLYGEYCARAQFLDGLAQKLQTGFEGRNVRAGKVVEGIRLSAEKLLQTKDLFEMAQRAQEKPSVPSMPPMTKAEGEELAALKKLSALSKGIKELYKELGELESEQTERLRFARARACTAQICTLALEYDQIFSRLKEEAGVLDYHDLERCALAVLGREEVRASLKEKYKYVFVDEYQDVNPVQEKIISLLAGENVFLVGDEKQAIYGFRGSHSDFFVEKAKSFEHSLRLSSNFRSARGILDAVNRVFVPVIEGYVPMRGGERYGDYDGKVCLHRIEKAEKEESAERGIYSVLTGAQDGDEGETARAVLKIVRQELGEFWYDVDEEREDERFKRVNYGDIAVLVRNKTGDAERIVRLLSARGVPVTTTAKVNVCAYFEAKLVIDWLSYLDNPEQDIPFAAALLSHIGGFSERELAVIRAYSKNCYTFRDACERYVQKNHDEISHKLLAFYARAEGLRATSCVRTAAEMINLLLGEGLETQICSKGDGANRLARLRRLIAEGENRSVHQFLRRIKDSQERLEYSASGGENAVKVLTMHTSKGLEYPVVILANLDTPFRGDSRDEIMWSEKFLFAPKSYDRENKTVSTTLLRRACEAEGDMRDVREERNLLYVAMTRAKCRLHLLFPPREQALSPAYAHCFADYFDFSALNDLWEEREESEPSALEREALVTGADEETVKEILSVYSLPYKYKDSVALPLKSSATELMREEQENEKPYFDKKAPSSTREEGLAYHAFLEHVVFGMPPEQELERMRAQGILSEEQLALLNTEKLKEILSIPCFKGLEGKRLYREQTFLIALPADEVPAFHTAAKDEVVFQGAIDLLCEDENGYTIIDYKYSSKDDEYLARHYAPQIGLYKKAVAKVKRVDERTVRARIVNILLCREIIM